MLFRSLAAAANYAPTEAHKLLLWSEINAMSQEAKKGKETNFSALWLFPVDMVSFVRELNVTDVIEEGLSDPAKLAT